MTCSSKSLFSWRILAHFVDSRLVESALKTRNMPSLRAAKFRLCLFTGSMVGLADNSNLIKYTLTPLYHCIAKSYGLFKCSSLIPAEAGWRRRNGRKQYPSSDIPDFGGLCSIRRWRGSSRDPKSSISEGVLNHTKYLINTLYACKFKNKIHLMFIF
jgi:hypothetical protein